MKKNIYFEPTIWYGEGRTHGCPLGTKKGYEEERRLSDVEKRLERATFAQIRRLIGPNAPRLVINEHGILEIEPLAITSKEELSAAYSILNSYRFGVYSRHQFKDWVQKDTTKKDYQRWFDQEKNAYLYTMPFKQLLGLSDYDREGRITFELTETIRFHSWSDEITRWNDGLGGYTINGIKSALENYFQPFIVLAMIGENVHIEEIDGTPYAVCTRTSNGKKVKLAASLYTKEIFYVRETGLKLIGNSYEYMFKALALPVETVLNSVLEVANPYALPCEGMGDYNKDHELISTVEKVYGTSDQREASKLTKISSYYRR